VDVTACPTTPDRLVDLDAIAVDAGVRSYSAPWLVVSGSEILFALGDQQSGAIVAVSVQGGATKLVAPIVGGIGWTPNTNVAVVGEQVVYVQGTTQTAQIMSVSLGGGTPTLLATTRAFPYSLATDAQYVYYQDGNYGVMRAPLGGGAVEIVTDEVGGTGYAESVATTGDTVLVGGVLADDAGSGGRIFSVPANGGSVVAVSPPASQLSGPVVCGQSICWWLGTGTAQQADSQPPRGSIFRASQGDGPTLLASNILMPNILAYDGRYFYETEFGDALEQPTYAIPTDGGVPSELLMGGLYVAIDSSCVYISSREGIFRMAKPAE
jgi:hypothetical protein